MKGNQWGPVDKRNLTRNEAYGWLAGEICVRAFRDYLAALKFVKSGNDRYVGQAKVLEKFFRGDWFCQLTNGKVDGEMVIEEARRQCRISKTI